MEDRIEYFNRLIEALEIKAENLEQSSIPRLREHFLGFETSVSAIYKFLIDKGIMQKDPYRHDRSITELKIPSTETLPETDTQQEISLRFSQYTSQWEFLVKIFHVSLASLTLKKVNLIMELLNYIRWTDLSTTSSYQVTRAISGILNRVSQMNDPMAGRMISNSAMNLGKISNSIKAELKTITVFLRERYKAEVREHITSKMKISIEQYRRKPVSIMDNVKFEFSHKMKEAGWYKELIHELLEEDYGTAAEKLREAVLERLKVNKPEEKRKKKSGNDDKTARMMILDRMSRTGEPIRSTVLKMNENTRVISQRKKSFSERLSEIFSSMFSKSDNRVIYEIPIKDPLTGSIHVEALNFTDFSSITLRKARLLQELQDPNSTPRKKAMAADSDHLIRFLETNIKELKTIHRRLNALEEYFQSDEVPRDVKGEMKSSGLNLKNLKNSIAETIRATNEFKLKKEEEEQLRKLGISD